MACRPAQFGLAVGGRWVPDLFEEPNLVLHLFDCLRQLLRMVKNVEMIDTYVKGGAHKLAKRGGEWRSAKATGRWDVLR